MWLPRPRGGCPRQGNHIGLPHRRGNPTTRNQFPFFIVAPKIIDHHIGTELAVWQAVIRYGLAFNISIFGFKKNFGQQFVVPYFMYDEKLGALSGVWLTWHYFGFSYPFGLIVAAFQIGGSLLLLFSRTRLLG